MLKGTIVVEKVLFDWDAKLYKNSILILKGFWHPQNGQKTFSVLSNPDFLSEGNAIADLESPERVLIGIEDEMAIEALANIYLNCPKSEDYSNKYLEFRIIKINC